METETTYKKGAKLEEMFAKYMKEELKYDKVRVRAHLPGKDNAKGTEADILARKSDMTKELVEDLKIPLAIASVLAGIFGYANLIDDVSIITVLKGIFPIVLIACIVSFILDQLISWEWAWAECKNLKGQTNINQVSKLIREYEDYNKVENKEYNIVKLIFVSANGFIENAIKYAKQKDIDCYQLDNNENFIESKYWS
jgi:hypothetical protein